MTLTTIKQQIQLNELDAWGSIADLGSEVLEGDVKVFGKMTFGAPTDAISSAYFGTTAGKFRMTYPFNEQATVVTGQVTLTDIASGTTHTYKVGDSWFVTKGTEVVWDVPGDGFVKHYLAIA
ncbi:MAG: cupin domain-containing protein [Pseudomonas sp.]|uniref:cupin domain-containing protein n=1 Tax=Pseudomonas abieticivorans TaxID=2931382 RepID=UPI0020BF9BD1|nr:cupin domain-containing protein [Pseudomonas sp. PIA16]MDE1165645.1 cupin domain-containing protein [Pseudomonas sp.]